MITQNKVAKNYK